MTAHILILCTHNSARSVLAEGLLNHWARKLGGDGGQRRAFELTRQAPGYRMLQLLALPIERMDAPALRDALRAIAAT